MSDKTTLARGWIAFHNGDYSGEVTFFEEPDDDEPAARIPFDVIVELVAEAVRTSAIANLEDADTAQLIPGLDPHMLTGGPEHVRLVYADAVQAEQTTETSPPLCTYCEEPEVFKGVCLSCWYDTGNVNGQRCVEHVVFASSKDGRCPNDVLGTSQHCADHQHRHSAVEDASVSEPRCAVCLEPTSYPIHIKAPTNAS